MYNGGCSRVLTCLAGRASALSTCHRGRRRGFGTRFMWCRGRRRSAGACGRTAVGAVESLLTSSCFRKGAESHRRHRAREAPSLLVWRSEPDGTPVLFPVA
jgi:hypothetical protein